MPVHTIESHMEASAFIDGMPVGFSSFDPAAGIDLLDPPAEAERWVPIVDPIAAKGEEEEYDDEEDDDDDDLWDDDDDDDDDDDFEDDDEEDFDDDAEDPFTLDDDEDDEF